MSIQIKTAAVTGPKTCEILELTTPDLGRGEVLVKVHAVALCTLEQRIFRGEVKMPLPCTGGHEVAGEIADLGPGVNTKLWAEGQRVAVRLLYNCGECYYCRTRKSRCGKACFPGRGDCAITSWWMPRLCSRSRIPSPTRKLA